MTNSKVARAIIEVSDSIAEHLAGMGPEVQGAILAELFSRWLAGHMLPDEPGAVEVEKMRDEIVGKWLKLVFEMTPANEAMIRETHGLPPSTMPPKGGMN
jgi:hypothetical protein